MDRDLTMMIYGTIMGVIESRQLRQIYLPTDEDVITINSGRHNADRPESQRNAAGSMGLSKVLTSLLIYQTHDPMLGFAFAAMLGFLMTTRVIQFLER